LDIQTPSDSISRFLHYTTEPFDDWDWDGEELIIILKNEIIERYTYNDLKEFIQDFQ